MILSYSKSPISKVRCEDTTLLSVLTHHLGTKMHLARKKLICKLILALCQVQTVNFERLASCFDTEAKKDSSLRRIQRFFASYILDKDMVARIVFELIPKDKKVGLTMDRTNWKFGQTNINILVLGVVYEGTAFPLLFTMLDKRGNSSTQERIELMERYDDLFGFDTLDYLVADREFIGHKWFDYLNKNNLSYHIRIRENFKVFIPRSNKNVEAKWLFSGLKMGQFKHHPKIVFINDVACYLSASVIKSKDGKPEYQFLVSYNNPAQSKDCYKKRWQIETLFKALKSSGFNLEKTHLQDIQRLEKLISIVFIAFVWCYLVGIHIHKNVKEIIIKKHGFKAKSLFKYGLEYIASKLLNPQNQSNLDIYRFFVM